ncbi:MAG: hypothetical protein RQ866_04400 [Bacteroidales bacterium]|nr:hypothetical protein [Bacteroidales bacterium]
MKNTSLLLIVLSVFVIFNGCKEDDPDPEVKGGKIVLNFHHQIDGDDVIYDTTMYVNEAGNHYQINEIQYFISDVRLTKDDGSQVLIDDEIDIYYVDADLPGTMKWQVFDKIPVGTYTDISFRFGISEDKNQSFMYVNPPEVNMFWPEILGGGYHYLKLNGKWIDTNQVLRAFDYHLGVGQIYPPNSHNYDSIIDFVHNDFMVSLQNSNFTIAEDQIVNIDLIMQVEEWFRNPHIYDHNVWGGYTMESQDAMAVIKANGHNVFKIGKIE